MTRQRLRSLNVAFFALLFIVFAALSPGCATKPAFNDNAADSSVGLQWATREATKLAVAGTITKAQLAPAIDASKAGTLAITTAKDLQKAGDLSGAEAQLAMASTILGSLRLFLANYGVKQ